MPLSPGSRLGPYEIVSPLGAGGMGEVYRARDGRLERTVAVKILTGGVGATPELQARFEREARAIAALQHPHICVLHDVGRDQGMPYLVMEYLEGETLAARLRRGRMPLTEVVRIGGEIAAALAAAHRAGIVHRDLKPGNVMLTAGGAKLLDFGLAKPGAAMAAAPPSFTASLAVTALESPVTQAGMVLGTVQYMAPEQIEGREADARSDIFALGCVLYEMAAGQRAFEGTSSLTVAAAILEKEPARLRTVQPLTPVAFEHVVEACLKKAPEARWQAAADVRTALGWAATPGEAAAAAPSKTEPRRRWLWPAVTAFAVIVAGGAAWAWRPRPAAMKLVASILAPPGTRLVLGGSDPGSPAISPDGRQIVFVARGASGHNELWLRALDQPAARELPGTEDAMLPFWSPDGGTIAYFTFSEASGQSGLNLFNLANGQSHALCQTGQPRGGTWAADGTILFSDNVDSPLYRIPASGGTPVQVTKFDAAQFSSQRFPYFLPDGKHFVYLAINHEDSGRDMIFWAALDGGPPKPLLHATSGAIYSAGYLLYSAGDTLMAQPLDPATGALHGTAMPVASGIYQDDITWRPSFSVSRNGVLVYAAGSPGPVQLVWLDRNSKVVASLPPQQGDISSAASVAPDGHHIAYSLDAGMQDIWTADVATGEQMRLTFGPVGNGFPSWSPDGNSIAYFTYENGLAYLERIAAHGGTPVRIPLPGGATGNTGVGSWSADGRYLLCVIGRSDNHLEVAAVPVGGQAAEQVLVPFTSDGLSFPKFSPDGHWVSYLNAPVGQLPDLYVVPFSAGGGKWQVTNQGVAGYTWDRANSELDVVDGSGKLFAIPFSDAGGAPVFGPPRLLASHFPPVLAAAPDAQHFVAVVYPNDSQRIMVDTDWEGKRR